MSHGVMHGLNRRLILHNQDGGHFPNVVANVNGERMVDLLTSLTTGHGELARTARELLRSMQEQRWSVAAGIHGGGLGGGGRGADPRLHITLRVGGAGRHVRLSNDGSRVIEIT